MSNNDYSDLKDQNEVYKETLEEVTGVRWEETHRGFEIADYLVNSRFHVAITDRPPISVGLWAWYVQTPQAVLQGSLNKTIRACAQSLMLFLSQDMSDLLTDLQSVSSLLDSDLFQLNRATGLKWKETEDGLYAADHVHETRYVIGQLPDGFFCKFIPGPVPDQMIVCRGDTPLEAYDGLRSVVTSFVEYHKD